MKCWETCDEEWVQSQSYSIIPIFIPNGDFPCFFEIVERTAVEGKGDEGREVEDKLRGVGRIGTGGTGVE